MNWTFDGRPVRIAKSHEFFRHLSIVGAVILISQVSAVAQSAADYPADIDFALSEIEKNCGHFFELKQIDWPAVSEEFRAAAKKVESDSDHLVLLARLLARLKDGHARVVPLEKGKDIKWPLPFEPKTGPGMFWCRIGERVPVKNSGSAARDAGIEPGMEIVEVNGEPVTGWLRNRQAGLADLFSFSTPRQRFFYTCHWGMAEPAGTPMTLAVRSSRAQSTLEEIEFKYTAADPVPRGPAWFPPSLDRTRDLQFGVLESGFGYLHIRRCKGDLNDHLDTALAKVGKVPGMIVIFAAFRAAASITTPSRDDSSRKGNGSRSPRTTSVRANIPTADRLSGLSTPPFAAPVKPRRAP